MSACLLDNKFVKQELHLCDKSKIYLYCERFEFLANLSKSPLCNSTLFLNFNVPGRSPLHGISLCTSMLSWDWTSVWGYPCVTRVCGAHGLPWTGRLTSKGGGSHSFALFVYDGTCEYAGEASDVPPHELCSIALAQGYSKVGSSGWGPKGRAEEIRIFFIMQWPFLPFSKIWQLSSLRAKKH